MSEGERVDEGGEPSARAWSTACLVSACCLVLLAALSGVHGFDGEFLYDDVSYITDNPQVQQGDPWSLFREPMARMKQLGLFRPLTFLTYWMQSSGRGREESPVPYHVFNVVVHCLVSLVLFAYLVEVLPVGVAALAAALFAVHPMHSEAVIWIVGRAELLCALLCIASLWALRRTGLPFTLLGSLLWLGACLCKETALVLPGLQLLLDQMRRRQWTTRALGTRYACFALLILVLFLWRRAVLGHFGPVKSLGPYGDESLLERLAIAARLLLRYVRVMLLPHPSRAFYHHSEFLHWQALDWVALAAALGLIAVHRRLAPLAAGFCIFLLPVLNVWPIQETFAERFLYLPSAFFCPLLSATLMLPVHRELSRRGRLGVSLVVPACAVLLFWVLSMHHNRQFHSALELWRNTLIHARAFPFPHYQIAFYMQASKIYTASPEDPELKGAIREFEEALRLNDEWLEKGERGMPPDQIARAHLNLGIMKGELAREQKFTIPEVESHFRKSLLVAASHPLLDLERIQASLSLARLRDPALGSRVTTSEAITLLEQALSTARSRSELGSFAANLEEELSAVKREIDGRQ